MVVMVMIAVSTRLLAGFLDGSAGAFQIGYVNNIGLYSVCIYSFCTKMEFSIKSAIIDRLSECTYEIDPNRPPATNDKRQHRRPTKHTHCVQVQVKSIPPKSTMSWSSFATVLTSTGMLLILHAAFSCQQYRSLVTDLGDAYSVPPVDVVAEIGLAFLLCLAGQLVGVGSLLPIKGGRKLMAPAYVTRDFDKYSHLKQALAKKA